MTSRRRVLAAGLGSLAALAGCQSDGGTTTRQPTSTRTTDDDSSVVTIDGIAVRKAVTYGSSMGSSGVLTTDGEQYVVASVRADRDISADEFAFAADGRTWSPGLPDTRGGTNRTVAGYDGGPVGVSLGPEEFDWSHLAYAVPSPLSGADARIEYEPTGQTWPLPESDRELLAEPEPAFEILSLDVPDTVTRGEPLSVSLTVKNTTGTLGSFLAAVYWPTTVADDDEATLIERTIAEDARMTIDRDIDTEYAPDPDGEPVTLELRGHVTADREVTVSDPESG